MLRKVLVGSDLSPASEAVIACLPHLRPVGTEEIVLAHVVHVSDTPGLEQRVIEAIAPILDGEAADLRRAGFVVTTELRIGLPALTLARLAERHGVDALVVGSHGRSLVGRILLGSVSSGVLHETARPVLLLRMQVCEPDARAYCKLACEHLFHHLLVPTDFSEAATRALKQLEPLVRETACAVTLLHVQEQVRLKHLMERLEEFNRIDRERLEQLQALIGGWGARQVDYTLDVGHPVRVITEQARSGRYSLIALGTQGRGALGEVMVGSVSINVARLSPVPVLVLPSHSELEARRRALAWESSLHAREE